MRLIGHVFKAIVGIVSSIAAVVSSGCVKSEEVKCYYGPAPVETAEHEQNDTGDPERVPSVRDIEQEPLDVYGPPPFEEEPVEAVEDVPTTIYGPPEAFRKDSELVPELRDEEPAKIYGPPEALNGVSNSPERELRGDQQKIQSPQYPVDNPGITVAYYGVYVPPESLTPKKITISKEQEQLIPKKPIVDDIKGQYKSIDADLLSVTPHKKDTQIKISVGSKDGVTTDSVGELYIGDELVKNGRFKITKINDRNSIALTNAPSELVKSATKLIVKIPVNSTKS
ncbi:MAG: hypothetical protein J6A01_11760 [Proteobacteria bacterium]|nr:hypothetical protein [Pseudomonadota bacterium]